MKKINLQSHMRELFREEGLLDHLPTFEEYIKEGYTWIEIFEVMAFESLNGL